MKVKWIWLLPLAIVACSSSDTDSTDAKAPDSDATEEASVDPDGGDDLSATDTQPSDAAEDVAPDLPQHPLVGRWSGNPADCFSRTTKKPAISMTFSVTEVKFRQFFMSGTNVCEHEGKGKVEELTAESFKLVGYKTTDTNCNLGMFLQGDQNIAFEFLDDEKTEVFLHPDKTECFLLDRK